MKVQIIRKTSVSFKESEDYMWEHLQGEINAAYYIKTLIKKDMEERGLLPNAKVTIKEETTKELKKRNADFSINV